MKPSNAARVTCVLLFCLGVTARATTFADGARALRIAGGLEAAEPDALDRFDRGGTPDVVDFTDALLTLRVAADEQKAIVNMDTILRGQRTFRARQQVPTYTSMAALFVSGLVDSYLGSGAKEGYEFRIRYDEDTFSATAVAYNPAASRIGDRYSFFVDQTGVLRAQTRTQIGQSDIATADSTAVVN